MKMSDIPQFTRQSAYTTDVGLRYIKSTLESYNEPLISLKTGQDVEGTHGLIMNPDFQRGHVWTKEQQQKYVEFILRGGRSGRDIYFNNPSHMRHYNKPYVVVDGLQRLTALIAFVDDELEVFDGIKCSDFEKISSDIVLKFHINDLETREEVLKWYLEMNDGGTPHSQEELDRVTELLRKEKAKNGSESKNV